MNNKPIFLLFLITPSAAFAGGVDVSYSLINGSSQYIVKSEQQKLESKLTFPYRLQTIGISAQSKIKGTPIKIGVNLPLYKKTLTGKDYDWHEDQLTVLSSSRNKLTSFYDLFMAWTPEAAAKFSYDVNLSYRKMTFDWYDTSQYDYVRSKQFIDSGNTLQFQQNVVLANLGMRYLLWSKKDIRLIANGAIRAGVGWLKDKHILRDFYILQTTWMLGYSGGLDFTYHLDGDSKLSLGYSVENMRGIENNMKYFTVYGGNEFASYPSRFKSLEQKINIIYSKSF